MAGNEKRHSGQSPGLGPLKNGARRVPAMARRVSAGLGGEEERKGLDGAEKQE